MCGYVGTGTAWGDAFVPAFGDAFEQSDGLVLRRVGLMQAEGAAGALALCPEGMRVCVWECVCLCLPFVPVVAVCLCTCLSVSVYVCMFVVQVVTACLSVCLSINLHVCACVLYR